ncbi:hypothetical protein V5N11_007044 [Cardamine amara subsp. amara]|uniref:SAM domain-containing protein n=1 Tax=Cardamine amara subsp. amara TaxID=228776 RepID=A0ABD1B8Q7_CARAN
MYSDRVEAKTGFIITANNGSGGRQITRKRERQVDDKWEHDLFEDDKPRNSKRRFDLRSEIQKKRNGLQSGGRGAVRDLRDTLSGTANPPFFNREAAIQTIKKFVGETKSETRKASNKAIKKKSHQTDASVERFLESLGLEKYYTSFQVEEVDMDALMHMTDDDLKALLIPMGPRKKILLALGS